MHAPIQAIDQAALDSARRLIVLIPDYRHLDAVQLGKDIRSLARCGKASVLYVTIVQRYEDEMPAIHSLQYLSSITNDACVRADALVEYGISWVPLVSRLHTPGDVVICFPEHRIRTKGLFHSPIAQALALKGNIPIYQFSNHSH